MRERASDIHLLAHSFVEKYNPAFSKSIREISRDAMRMLMDYPWPGNVRQLDAVIEKSVLLTQGDTIGPGDIDLPVTQEESSVGGIFPTQGMTLDDIERKVILDAVEKSGGCITLAAKSLGTTYRTVEYRLKKYGIERAHPPKGE